jgi:hypothetical protein
MPPIGRLGALPRWARGCPGPQKTRRLLTVGGRRAQRGAWCRALLNLWRLYFRPGVLARAYWQDPLPEHVVNT